MIYLVRAGGTSRTNSEARTARVGLSLADGRACVSQQIGELSSLIII